MTKFCLYHLKGVEVSHLQGGRLEGVPLSLLCCSQQYTIVIVLTTVYLPQPPVVPRDDVLVSLTTNLVQAVLQLKNRFKGATAEDYVEFVKVTYRQSSLK